MTGRKFSATTLRPTLQTVTSAEISSVSEDILHYSSLFRYDLTSAHYLFMKCVSSIPISSSWIHLWRHSGRFIDERPQASYWQKDAPIAGCLCEDAA